MAKHRSLLKLVQSSREATSLFDRCKSTRWLAPDGEFEVLGPDARRWVEERLDEHLAALQPFAKTELTVGTVEFHRDLHAAFDASRSVLGVSEQESELLAWSDALRTAENTLLAEAMEQLGIDRTVRFQWHTELAKSLNDIAWSSVGWTMMKGRNYGDPFPFLRELTMALLAFSVGEKTSSRAWPWLPVLEIWLRGAWPFRMSEGFGVYVPVLRNGYVEHVPASTAKRTELEGVDFLFDARKPNRKGFTEE